MADELRLTLDDIHQYLLRFGLDLFPPLELANEQFRAQSLYRALVESWPQFFAKLSLSAGEFVISRRFPVGSAEAEVPAFTYTPRGPVVVMPIKLAGYSVPGSDEHKLVADFQNILGIIRNVFPGREVLRIGLVRELVFSTGETRADPVLLPVSDEFGGARFIGGESQLVFRDSICNIRVHLKPGEIRQRLESPIGIARENHLAFGLNVEFDVNNVEMRPLQDADIAQVLERAKSLWPGALLDYLNRRASC